MANSEQEVPTKAKLYTFKDLLLGKLSIPKLDEEINETSDIGKKESMVIKLNDILLS
jgi:hypothetical protein